MPPLNEANQQPKAKATAKATEQDFTTVSTVTSLVTTVPTVPSLASEATLVVPVSAVKPLTLAQEYKSGKGVVSKTPEEYQGYIAQNWAYPTIPAYTTVSTEKNRRVSGYIAQNWPYPTISGGRVHSEKTRTGRCPELQDQECRNEEKVG